MDDVDSKVYSTIRLPLQEVLVVSVGDMIDDVIDSATKISLNSSWLRLCSALCTAEVDGPEALCACFQMARFVFCPVLIFGELTAAYTALRSHPVVADS